MVKEVKIVFDPQDIRQFRLVCKKCKSEFARPLPQEEYKLPSRCPVCREFWWDDRYSAQGEIGAIVNLLEAVNTLSKMQEDGKLQFDVRFETDE